MSAGALQIRVWKGMVSDTKLKQRRTTTTRHFETKGCQREPRNLQKQVLCNWCEKIKKRTRKTQSSSNHHLVKHHPNIIQTVPNTIRTSPTQSHKRQQSNIQTSVKHRQYITKTSLTHHQIITDLALKTALCILNPTSRVMFLYLLL